MRPCRARVSDTLARRASLKPEQNQWELVDDFDWLKADHSPNWAVLPEAERKAPALAEVAEDVEVS